MATKSNGFTACGQYYSMPVNDELGYIDSLKLQMAEIRESFIKSKQQLNN